MAALSAMCGGVERVRGAHPGIGDGAAAVALGAELRDLPALRRRAFPPGLDEE